MSYSQATHTPVAHLQETDRVAFMVKVYQHLGLAIGAFMAFEYLFFASGIAKTYGKCLPEMEELGFFRGLSAGNDSTQASYDLENVGRQYGSLFAISAVEALIFAPFLYYVFNVRQAAGDVWVCHYYAMDSPASLVGWVTRTASHSYGQFLSGVESQQRSS